MTNPRNPFRINVGFIIHEEIGYNREFLFALDKIQLDEGFNLRQLEGAVNVGKTPQGLIVQGNFQATTNLDCVRCLNGFEEPLEWSFTELYAFDHRSVTESGLILPEDAQLDLSTLVREYALLEIPIGPVCKPQCRGLCAECGQNLNEMDCGHRPPAPESPFARLKDLKG